MANISAIKVGSTSYGLTPASHASTATTYGAATASNYGHVKLSDNYTSSAGAAASGIGASSAAVYNAYKTLDSNKCHMRRVRCPGYENGRPTTTTIATDLEKGILILPNVHAGNGIFIITSATSIYTLYQTGNTSIKPTLSSGTLSISNAYETFIALLIR